MTLSRLWPSSSSSSSLAVATSVIATTAVGCLSGAVAAVVVATLLLLHRRQQLPRLLPADRGTGKRARTKVVPVPLQPGEWRLFEEQAEGEGEGEGGEGSGEAGGRGRSDKQLVIGRAEEVIGRVREGGCAPSIRQQVWPFLLGLYSPASSSSSQRSRQREHCRLLFDELRVRARQIGQQAERAAEEEEKRRREEEEEEKKREKLKEKEREIGRACNKSEGRERAVGSSGCEDAVVEEVYDVLTDENENDNESGAMSEPAVLLSDSVESFVEVEGDRGGEEGEEVEGVGRSDEGMEVGGRSSSSAATYDGTAADDARCNTAQQGSTQGSTESDSEASKPVSTAAAAQARVRELESFATWRRIIRLDAIRMNAAWLPHSTQQHFPPSQADQAAAEVGFQPSDVAHLSAPQRLHAARLVTILEAYAAWDPAVGYCQGMSDLLSPFVALFEDNAEAFSCFACLMQSARHNFRTDERGISRQLARVGGVLAAYDPALFAHLRAIGADNCFFLYRSVVVLLRRELSFESTVLLWEVAWAEAAAAAAQSHIAAAAEAVGGEVLMRWDGRDSGDRSEPAGRGVGASGAGAWGGGGIASSEFILLVAAAVVECEREAVMRCEGLDELLQLCNGVAGRRDIWDLIHTARRMAATAGVTAQE